MSDLWTTRLPAGSPFDLRCSLTGARLTNGCSRERALASVFRLLKMWIRAEQSDSASADALDFRYMMSLAKAVFTNECTQLMHRALMILGANGMEERFSPLPRLYRDSIIMETWEGPHGVLFAQVQHDMMRFQVDVHQFVARMSGPGHRQLADELAQILSNSEAPDSTLRFARFARSLVLAFGDRALVE